MNFKIKQRVDLYNSVNEVQYTDCEIIDIVPGKKRPSEEVQMTMLTNSSKDGKLIRTKCSTMAHTLTRYLVRVSPTLVHLVYGKSINLTTHKRAPFPKSFLNLVALENGFTDWETAQFMLSDFEFMKLTRKAGLTAERNRVRVKGVLLIKETGEGVEDFQKRVLDALNIIWVNDIHPTKEDIEKLKKFTSERPDHFREAYGVHKDRISLNGFPRQAVLTGTTNKTSLEETQTAEVIQWFFEQGTRRHLIVANRLKHLINS